MVIADWLLGSSMHIPPWEAFLRLLAAVLVGAVVGFDRYGRTVAALVPVEAIYMLSGMGGKIDPDIRQKIERAARSFVMKVPNRIGKKMASKAAPAKKKAASSSAASKARARRR